MGKLTTGVKMGAVESTEFECSIEGDGAIVIFTHCAKK
jgi:hypothetical protein